MRNKKNITTYTIRQAKLDDIENICIVERSAFPSHRQASAETLANRINLFPEGCYVIECDERIVGFSTALIINNLKSLEAFIESDSQLHNSKGNTYYLRSVGIKQNYQKIGLGKALIAQQLKNAHNLNKKYFRFTASEDVEFFYTKLGFTRITNYCNFHGSIQAVWEMEIK
ncbi:hypothetical protein A2335_00035 [Candidatus Peregrinibacteria bacterium RIFOXYB2_FULL_32_7]|nr:MAG: hypothetical protein A2335_00035 [Candidatus Peregrinibacteria bacterium RIFOXYB2_FULL_32_7]